MLRLIPKSLFYRFLIIILMPMLLLQLVITVIFYQRHWENVTDHMQEVLVSEINLALSVLSNQNRDLLHNINLLSLKVDLLDKAESYHLSYLNNLKKDRDLISFEKKLDNVKYALLAIGYDSEGTIISYFQLPNRIVQISFSSKRIKSPTTYIFMAWMLGASTLLIIVSVTFMKNQIKSILRLTEVADAFGKGRNVAYFRPTGAKEIKTAGNAFIRMKKRIERQIKYRAELLAYISHDLRTPLTRIKLQVAMLEDKSIAEDISHDLLEMERMIREYLNFIKGEGNETLSQIEIVSFINSTLSKFDDSRLDKEVKFKEQYIFVRPNALQRAIVNVLQNAIKYAKSKVTITLLKVDGNIRIMVDDDGQGIKDKDYKIVFKPFQKLNIQSEGYGLGLAIVKSIIQAHGGKIMLAKSPYNGLRVTMILPV